MQDYIIRPVGDAAVSVECGEKIDPAVNARVHALRARLEKARLPFITDMIPAFCSLLVCYDPALIRCDALCREIRRAARFHSGRRAPAGRTFLLSVCYGGAFGEDLPYVAEHAGLSEEEVVRRHTAPDYLIYMLGFLPGFAYLGGLDPLLETPRLPRPRQRIPAGSVGIGGNQTGLYPLDSPGGWRLIGRSPVHPWDPRRAEPILWRAGDRIRFVPVDETEYGEIEAAVNEGVYVCPMLEGGGRL